ncbi:MAG: glycogen synthase [Clostridia bacterium]|nr:glycogen synthase [Clostridia bacterium]
MRIAIAASEAAPFVKTGGLGDVLQALPAELARIPGNEIVLFLPYYKRIKYHSDTPVTFVGSFSMGLSWREQYVGLFKLKSRKKKLQIYFIDNEYYFGRDSVYGDYDDGERFAFFSKAVLACMNYIGFEPDILHCHDWQTALIPVYFRALYQSRWPSTRLIFTIHNVEYQGKADPAFFEDTIGLPAEYKDILSFDGCLNFMKGAIALSDRVTTVSKTYSQELKYPYYAHGLDGVLAGCGEKLTGITNGIDVDVYNPQTDSALSANFSAKNLKGKAENKLALQRELGLNEAPDVPVMAMVTRLVGHKGIDLLTYILHRLMDREVQLVIVGTGDRMYEQLLAGMAASYPGRFSMNLRFDPKLASCVYAGADIYLMPSKSEPCGLSQLIAMHYGTIPVVNATGGLKDTVPPYNPQSKDGRGFNFQSYNADDFLAAIDRAITLYYNDKKAWNDLMRRDMEFDCSWKAPAQEYMALYQSLL